MEFDTESSSTCWHEGLMLQMKEAVSVKDTISWTSNKRLTRADKEEYSKHIMQTAKSVLERSLEDEAAFRLLGIASSDIDQHAGESSPEEDREKSDDEKDFVAKLRREDRPVQVYLILSSFKLSHAIIIIFFNLLRGFVTRSCGWGTLSAFTTTGCSVAST